VAYGLGRLLWGLSVEGLENVPRKGPVLFTSNHVSNFDPPLIGAVIPRESGFAAKRELFAVPVLATVIRSLNAIPVDRARLSIAAVRAMGRLLERGVSLLFFPEGTRSRTGDLGSPRIGVGLLLTHHPVTIVPVYIEGTDSLLRSFLRRGRLRVRFGRPYTLPRDDEASTPRRERYRRIAETVMSRIRALKEGSSRIPSEGGTRG
jgi:1-acyl-sn-glycerol-3-phosphate acyltransferase